MDKFDDLMYGMWHDLVEEYKEMYKEERAMNNELAEKIRVLEEVNAKLRKRIKEMKNGNLHKSSSC